MEDKKKIELDSFLQFIKRPLEPEKPIDPRTGHLAWTKKDQVERHEKIDEDVGQSHYPHLKNLPESEWDDHQDHEMGKDEHSSHLSHFNSLSDHEMEQAMAYKTSSENYNDRLRTGIGHAPGKILVSKSAPRDQDMREYHQSLKDGFESLDRVTSHRVPNDMVVYRGVHHDAEMHTMVPGEKFTDHGYTGTSLKKSIAESHATSHGNLDPWNRHADPRVPPDLEGHKIIAKIHVPKGTKAHYLDVGQNHYHHAEHEVLLHRGTQFEVMKHEKVSGPNPVHLIHMRVVGQKPRPIIVHSDLGK